jgi:hypothetical protein
MEEEAGVLDDAAFDVSDATLRALAVEVSFVAQETAAVAGDMAEALGGELEDGLDPSTARLTATIALTELVSGYLNTEDLSVQLTEIALALEDDCPDVAGSLVARMGP